MKRLIFILTFTFSFLQVFAQQKEESIDLSFLYRIEPEIKETDPEWVHYLYEKNPNLYKIQKAYEQYYSRNIFTKTLHTQNYKYFMQKVYDEMEILPNGYLSVYNQSSNTNSSVGNGWRSIGPSRTYKGNSNYVLKSNQVNTYCMDYSLTNPNKIICGNTAGVVHLSEDKGQTWTTLGYDDLNTGSLTAVRFHPTNENIMFAGGGDNLYKTTDGGATWVNILNISNLTITQLAIDFNNPNNMYLSAKKGLYKSSDGGVNWTSLNSNKHWDVKLNPLNPNTVYTIRTDLVKNFSEFWKSTDQGESFELKSTGWFNPVLGSSWDNGGRIGVTPDDTNRIYTVLLATDADSVNDSGFAGIYRSDDSGESWSLPYDGNGDGIPDNEPGGPYSQDHWCFTSFNTSTSGYHQGYYNLALYVSPTNKDRFMVGFLNLFGTDDGGETYEAYGGYQNTVGGGYSQHPDIQDIMFFDNKFYVSSDGGIDTYDSTFSYIESNIDGIIGSNYWGFDNGWNKDVMIGGRFHNGDAVHLDNYGTGNFIHLGGGESATGYVNIGDERKVYHSDCPAYIAPLQISDPINTTRKYTKWPNQTYQRHGSSEIVLDPRYYNNFYFGKDNKFWKTYDGGFTHELIKEFGTDASIKVTQIEISRNNPDLLFVVHKDELWKTTNAGDTWTQVSLPSSSSYVSISLNADDVLFVGFNTTNSSVGKIYKSNNFGNTWQNLTTPTLSTYKVDYIAVQEGTNNGVYIGTSNEIWYKDDLMSDWTKISEGMPVRIRIREIIPFYKKNLLRVATNMGIWEKELEGTSTPIAQPITKTDKTYCSRDTITFDSYSVLVDSNMSFDWDFPGATYVSSTTVRNPKVVFGNVGSYNVTLSVENDLGSDSKTIPNLITVEANYCQADSNAERSLKLNHTSVQTDDFTDSPVYEDVTFSMWIKPDTIQSKLTGLITFFSHNAHNETYVLHFWDNNELRYHWKGKNWNIPSNLYVTPNEWNYIAMSVHEDTVNLYLNNQKSTTILPAEAVQAVHMKNINVGSFRNWGNRKFRGEIDEVKVWSRILSEEEIQLKRHLTIPNPNSETDLIAYYQFNNWSNLIYDKLGVKHLNKENNMSLVPSSLPVGAGISERIDISNAGLYNFNSTNCEVDLDSNGLTANSSFVVSELSAIPFHRPNTLSLHDKYWIINDYKTNAEPMINSIQFADIDHLSYVNSTNVSIWHRNENDGDINNWDDVSNNFTIYTDSLKASNIYINNAGQFYLGTTVDNLNIPRNEPLESKHTLSLYPNPVHQGSVLNYVNTLDGEVKIRIFNVSGKLVGNHSFEGKSIQIPISKTYKPGTYFLSIEGKSKIINTTFIILE
jgi:photosystem II stability/assembly factor-like uncharacterized protein